MALVTDTFPEDTQKHLMVYHDPSIQTLNDGLRRLMRVSNPILRYVQTIAVAYPTLDRTYENHVTHHADVGMFHLSFPADCTIIGNIRNSGKCRMVSYYRDPKNGYVREWTITRKDMIRNIKGLEVIIYTNMIRDLTITYDVYLFKPAIASRL